MALRGEDDKPDRQENDTRLSLTAREVSITVHELRGAGSVATGYLGMLKRGIGPPLSEQQLHMLDEIIKSSEKMMAIVKELSDIGKLDSGVLKLERKPLDVFSLVGEVAELVHKAKEYEVRLTLRGDDDGAPLSGDSTRLRMAFHAIFRAILREKPGPATVIAERRRVRRDGRTAAVVIVSDEASVQEAYEREPAPFFEKRGGLGLALPLARRVIEGHGGRLWSPKPVLVDDDAERPVDVERPGDALSRGSAIVSLPLTE
jgi:signal transduction histidine kinase